MESITPHTHNDTDSPKLYAKDSLQGAPQEPLTAVSVALLSSGGTNDLKTSDANILNNALIRLAELEAKLITLGLVKYRLD